jgi:hypothetical protein
LTANDFELNPYDPCIANQMVNGKQQTCGFHVDDVVLTCADVSTNDHFIDTLQQEYKSVFVDSSGKMTVHRSKVHDYLGMRLDFSVESQVKASMLDYIDGILTDWKKVASDAQGTKASAAPRDLFVVNEDCEKLEKKQAKGFHYFVAKTLLATKRVRPDTGTSISLLTTRLRGLDCDDWRKLLHLMKHLSGTRRLSLILSANGTGILKWWVDRSFAVHLNMRGHTGGGLSMGHRFPISNSTKQMLNMRSSTETEIVGANEMMPAILRTRNFWKRKVMV